ncbi:DALR anticodon-binding domain-containing protein [Neosynechococcus sphagnicola]|uniref:DALR anticodon-binding domain-containing protein n=1 Tax=Neosynechococcus sphagnicola TaxID=1501145 RepID=UPI00068D0974|nr:DALR anticodon-binding domain-containing protein [Neosynechococcus sphagnicola]
MDALSVSQSSLLGLKSQLLQRLAVVLENHLSQQPHPSKLLSADRAWQWVTKPYPQTQDWQGGYYRSAIAHLLAQVWQQPPLEIAQQIVTIFNQAQLSDPVSGDGHGRSHSSVPRLLSEHRKLSMGEAFKLHGDVAARLQATLTAPGLATWLHQCLATLPHWHGGQPSVLTPSYLPPPRQLQVQYAHARCCALLRLAALEGLVAYSQPWSDYPSRLQLTTSIPWLDPQQQLWLSHPAESHLLAQLVLIMDAIDSGSPPRRCTNSLIQLVEAFESCDRACQIWGEPSSKTSTLALNRLGLVAITQAVLRFFLEGYLGLIAPWEL